MLDSEQQNEKTFVLRQFSPHAVKFPRAGPRSDPLEREVTMVNRKLIRPTLSNLKEPSSSKHGSSQKKRVPPEQTSAEQYYYLKQMSSRTSVVVKLLDGEEVRGIIEWYDKDCIKVNREAEPNLLIPKHSIKYLYKEDEESGSDENVLSEEAEQYR